MWQKLDECKTINVLGIWIRLLLGAMLVNVEIISMLFNWYLVSYIIINSHIALHLFTTSSFCGFPLLFFQFNRWLNDHPMRIPVFFFDSMDRNSYHKQGFLFKILKFWIEKFETSQPKWSKRSMNETFTLWNPCTVTHDYSMSHYFLIFSWPILDFWK